MYRYLPGGTRDNTFGTNGYTNLNNNLATCAGSAVQADGRILTVGTILILQPKSQTTDGEFVARFQGAAQAAANRSALVAKASVNSNKLDVQVYSNPSHDHFRVRVSTGNATDKINLRVVDLSGKTIEVASGVQAGGVEELGATYPSGTYIIDVIKGSSHKAVRVMKL